MAQSPSQQRDDSIWWQYRLADEKYSEAKENFNKPLKRKSAEAALSEAMTISDNLISVESLHSDSSVRSDIWKLRGDLYLMYRYRYTMSGWGYGLVELQTAQRSYIRAVQLDPIPSGKHEGAEKYKRKALDENLRECLDTAIYYSASKSALDFHLFASTLVYEGCAGLRYPCDTAACYNVVAEAYNIGSCDTAIRYANILIDKYAYPGGVTLLADIYLNCVRDSSKYYGVLVNHYNKNKRKGLQTEETTVYGMVRYLIAKKRPKSADSLLLDWMPTDDRHVSRTVLGYHYFSMAFPEAMDVAIESMPQFKGDIALFDSILYRGIYHLKQVDQRSPEYVDACPILGATYLLLGRVHKQTDRGNWEKETLQGETFQANCPEESAIVENNPKPEPVNVLVNGRFTTNDSIVDLGQIAKGDRKKHSFLFINNTDAPVTIVKADRPAGYIVVAFPKDPIKSGGRTSLEVSVDNDSNYKGKLEKKIRVEDDKGGVTVLTLKFEFI